MVAKAEGEAKRISAEKSNQIAVERRKQKRRLQLLRIGFIQTKRNLRLMQSTIPKLN